MTDPFPRAALTSDDIPPGPFSEDDLRQQWNTQADKGDQWDSLDSSEQLAWAQARAIAADRSRCPATRAVPAQPEGHGLTEDQLDVAVIAIQALIPSPNPWDTHSLEAVDRGREILQRAFARWGRLAAPPAPQAGDGRWSEAVCGDGAAILCDGVMVSIEEVVRALNRIPAAPPEPEAGEVMDWLKSQAAHLRKMQEIGALTETELQEMLDRAATLLQQQQLRIANLRSALADCGRAVGASISDDCSDGFLLEVPGEVRMAAAKDAPAVVSVAVSERLPIAAP